MYIPLHKYSHPWNFSILGRVYKLIWTHTVCICSTYTPIFSWLIWWYLNKNNAYNFSFSAEKYSIGASPMCIYIYIKKELALPFVLNLLKTNPRTLNPHQTLCDVILNGLMFYRKAIFLKSRHKQCCDYSKPDRLILLLYHIKNPFRHLVNYINSLPSLLHA